MAKKTSENVAYVVGTKAIDALIGRIAKTASALKADIHLACLSAAWHLANHGDVGPVNRLCEASKDVVHNNAVHRWFEVYGCVTWNQKDKTFHVDKARLAEASNNTASYNESLSKAPTYYDLTKAPEFSPVKVLAKVKAILKSVEKMTDEERANERNDLRGLDDLKNFVERYEKLAA